MREWINDYMNEWTNKKNVWVFMSLCANVGQTGPGETDDSEINQMTLSSKWFELGGQSRYLSIT